MHCLHMAMLCIYCLHICCFDLSFLIKFFVEKFIDTIIKNSIWVSVSMKYVLQNRNILMRQ